MLSEKGWLGLIINTADRNTTDLVKYIIFWIGVKGIWRKVYIFIKPESEGSKNELFLLLGLP